MPKLSNNSNYFTLESAAGYRMFLDHFRSQADGKSHNIFIKPSGTNRFGGNKHCLQLRYVNLASHQNPADMPKVEAVDPNEAVKNRANSELNRELQNKSNEEVQVPQSTKGRRKRNITKSTALEASKVVKRAKDYFDR